MIALRRACLACLPLLLLAGGCSGGGVAARAAPACQDASAELVQRITQLAPDGSRFTVRGSAGQKASKAGTWWVGVRFTTKGSAAPRTGVWAVGSGLDGRGTLLAVDPVAQQWSQAVDADTSASKIPDTDGKDVLACL